MTSDAQEQSPSYDSGLGRAIWQAISVAFGFMFFRYAVRQMFSKNTKERYEGNGYFVWAVALWVFAIPELYGSIKGTEGRIPTLSNTVGNLINDHDWVSVFVIAVLFGCVVHILRVQAPALKQALAGPAASDEATAGHWTMSAAESGRVTRSHGDSPLPVVVWYEFAAFAVTVVAFAVPLVLGSGKQTVGLSGYGVLFGLLFVVPGFLARSRDKLVAFAPLFTTVGFLEKRSPAIAFVLGFGLVYLALHLTFYPFPSILPDLQGLHHHCLQTPTPRICVNPTP